MSDLQTGYVLGLLYGRNLSYPFCYVVTSTTSQKTITKPLKILVKLPQSRPSLAKIPRILQELMTELSVLWLLLLVFYGANLLGGIEH